MPAPELTVKVPGETADTSAAAAGTTSTDAPDERLAAVLTLSKQTVAVITEALPTLVAGDLIALRDLEIAGSNRKGVIEAIEAEDARRAALTSEGEELRGTASPEDLPILIETWMLTDEDAVLLTVAERITRNASPDEESRLEVAYAIARHLGLDWPAAQIGPLLSADPAAPKPVAAGQAVLTDAGWVVPEPPKKD